MTPFQEAILRVVRLVPVGYVVSYGQVAAYVGMPRAARQVGQAMRSMEGAPDFPWWRVINNAGKITIRGAEYATPRMQRELLEGEGIPVSDLYELDIKKHRFYPTAAQLKELKLDEDYIKTLSVKYEVGA